MKQEDLKKEIEELKLNRNISDKGWYAEMCKLTILKNKFENGKQYS